MASPQRLHRRHRCVLLLCSVPLRRRDDEHPDNILPCSGLCCSPPCVLRRGMADAAAVGGIGACALCSVARGGWEGADISLILGLLMEALFSGSHSLRASGYVWTSDSCCGAPRRGVGCRPRGKLTARTQGSTEFL